jgi:molybdate transport system permease protein
MDWTAIALSARLAAATTLILLPLALPLGYWLARSRWRYRFLVEAVVALPLVLPPTVLGFYLLRAFGPEGALGGPYRALTGAPLAFTFQGLLVASVVYSLPFAVQPIATAFARVEPALLEASYTLGASRWRTFARVTLPLSRMGVLSGAVLAFAHTVGEFGVVLMVGGNRRGQTRTASIAVYDAMESLDYAAAGRTSAFLLAASFAVLALVYGLSRRARGAWPMNF